MRWRILAELVWTPDAKALYYAPALGSDDAKANAIHARARREAVALHESLFPPDPPEA